MTAEAPAASKGGAFAVRPGFGIERLARLTPAFIAAYFTAQFIVRLLASGNLETDEAQFVGLTHFALGYGNAHPPLYNWLVSLALEATGYWPAAVSLVKNLLLAGTYLLVFDTGRRATGSAVAGLCAAAGLALMPQIVWQSQFTLAHSVLVTFGAAALLHALTLIVQRPQSWLAYVYLGAAAAVGAHGKYNFFIVLVAALAVMLASKDLRGLLLNWRALLSAGSFAALFGPHLVWALGHLDEATNRVSKLQRENAMFGALDLPGLGVDGLLSVGVAAAVSAGPLLLVWFLARGRNPATSDTGNSDAFLRLYKGTAIVAFSLFAAIILFGDFHFVFERYLTPLLLPVPLWLALASPLSARAAGRLAATAGAVWLAVLIAIPSVIAFGKDHFAYPYRAMAAKVAEQVEPPYAILARRDRQSANLSIRLPGTAVLREEAPPDRVLIVWSGNADRRPSSLVEQLGQAFAPDGPVLSGAFPYENLSGARATMSAQLFVRR